jgi:starch synthase
MKILFVAAEVAPFIKVGGLADVAGALPATLAALGHDVRIVVPRYGRISIERYKLLPKVTLNIPVGTTSTSTTILEGALPTPDNAQPVPIYFIENSKYFDRPAVYGYPDDGERFIVFCRAVLEMLPLLEWLPDIIHTNDWHSGLIPNYLKTLYADNAWLKEVRTVFTIHNLAYQGVFETSWLALAGLKSYGNIKAEQPDTVNIMARAITFADAINTVSPTYAREILTPQNGEGLDNLLRKRETPVWGILNGIDYSIFNPASDRYLSSNFDIESLEKRPANKTQLQSRLGLPTTPTTPLLGLISRLAEQKGFDLLVEAAPKILERGVQVVILGTGDALYQEKLEALAQLYPDQMRLVLAFDLELAQQIYAGSDFFLMPSRFEPCGLGQLIAMRYGAVPVVRYTGGLADTVQEYDPNNNTGNGFLFGPYEPAHLIGAIDRALAIYARPDHWQQLLRINMQRDYSWQAAALSYIDFYQQTSRSDET